MPAGSAYSADGVKRRRVENEAAALVARNLKLKNKHIRRNMILQDPLLGGSLAREHGHREFLDAAVRTYTQGWDAREILHAEHVDVFSSPYPPVDTTQTIAAFDFDPVTRTLFCRKSHLLFSGHRLYLRRYFMVLQAPPLILFSLLMIIAAVRGGTLWAFPERDRDVWFNDQEETMQEKRMPIKRAFGRIYGESIITSSTPITSVNINPTTRMILTTWQAPPAGHNMLLARVIDTEGPVGPALAVPGT